MTTRHRNPGCVWVAYDNTDTETLVCGWAVWLQDTETLDLCVGGLWQQHRYRIHGLVCEWAVWLHISEIQKPCTDVWVGCMTTEHTETLYWSVGGLYDYIYQRYRNPVLKYGWAVWLHIAEIQKPCTEVWVGCMTTYSRDTETLDWWDGWAVWQYITCAVIWEWFNYRKKSVKK